MSLILPISLGLDGSWLHFMTKADRIRRALTLRRFVAAHHLLVQALGQGQGRVVSLAHHADDAGVFFLDDRQEDFGLVGENWPNRAPVERPARPGDIAQGGRLEAAFTKKPGCRFEDFQAVAFFRTRAVSGRQGLVLVAGGYGRFYSDHT